MYRRPPAATDRADRTSTTRSTSAAGTSPATASTYTACPRFSGTVESKATIPTSARAAMFVECRVPGRAW